MDADLAPHLNSRQASRKQTTAVMQSCYSSRPSSLCNAAAVPITSTAGSTLTTSLPGHIINTLCCSTSAKPLQLSNDRWFCCCSSLCWHGVMFMCLAGDIDCLAEFARTSSTAAVNDYDDEGQAALHVAADKGNTEAISILTCTCTERCVRENLFQQDSTHGCK